MSADAGEVRVELVGLEAFGPHGVTEAEREVGCRILLDISFSVPECGAVADDELDSTVDYSAVARLATELVAERSCRTLEHLCAAIAEEITSRFDVAGLVVRAAKPEPLMAEVVDEVAVTLRWAGGG